MRPTSLQDALLRAKSLIKEAHHHFNPTRKFHNYGNKRGRFEQPRLAPIPVIPPTVPRVYAAVRNPNNNKKFPNVRCFGCNELGHYKIRCPKLARQVAAIAAAPTPNPPRGNMNPRGRRNGGRDRVARIYGRGRGQPAGRVHAALGGPTLATETGERARLFAAIDNPVQLNNMRLSRPQQHTKVRSFSFLLIAEAHIHFGLLNV